MEIAVPFVEESVSDVTYKINKYIDNNNFRVKAIACCTPNSFDNIRVIVIFTDEKEK